MFRTLAGQVSSSSTDEIVEFSHKIQAKCIYIGKVKSNVSSIDVRHDRIVFSNITNGGQTKAKYNITVPYVEIIALRYCFDRDISIFVIQPIYESYEKLSKWINANSLNRFIPENFIMIQFESNKNVEPQIFTSIKYSAKLLNRDIKIIEINSVFARTYLNTPNKSNNGRSTISKPSVATQEVIHLDDDDDHDDTKGNILNRMILKYPDNEPNSIILYGNDLNCVRDGQYLNDNIMNFYLKYYQYNGAILDRKTLNKIFIYDALFASNLLMNPKKKKHQIDLKGYDVYTQDTFGDIYQKNLKQWTKDIDIFSKDYIIIPIVKDFHWYLVILCHIGNLSMTSQSNGHSSDRNAHEKPTIIVLYSLSNNQPRSEVSKAIFKYLQLEYKEKRQASENFNMNSLRELFPKVPMQQNYYDCGLFVLEYIERFLINPDKVLKTIENDSCSLTSWFDAASLNTKRAKIKQIILNFLPPEDAVKLECELDKSAQTEDERPSTPHWQRIIYELFGLMIKLIQLRFVNTHLVLYRPYAFLS